MSRQPQVKHRKKLSPQPVLYLCRGFPVVSETFISDQVESLIQRGVAVKVLALMPGNNPQRTEQWHANPAHAGVLQVMYPAGLGSKKGLLVKTALSLPGTFLKVLQRPSSWGLTLYCMRHMPAIFAEASLAAAWLRHHPQQGSVLVCHFGTIGYMGALLKAWGCLPSAMPQVSVFHGYDISRILKKKPADFYQKLFASPGHISLTITKYWQNRLKELGDADPQLIKLGVDITKFSYKPRAFPKSRPVRFISVGRLTEKKGYLKTLEAFAKLSPNLVWEYTIIGAGPQQAELEHKIASLNLQGKVHFLGARPHSETRDRLLDADAFILASHTAADGDMEALPLALLEAAASGLPIVTSTHSAIPEFFTDGKNGLVAEEANVASLAKKLEQLITKPNLWPVLVKAARQDMERLQDFRVHSAQFESYIRKLMK
jgi:colanic acid/amylovoran biosynthesis glycosyltransferase